MIGEDRPVGTVTIGNDNQPMCVPSNATITVLGRASKVVTKESYKLEFCTKQLII